MQLYKYYNLNLLIENFKDTSFHGFNIENIW